MELELELQWQGAFGGAAGKGYGRAGHDGWDKRNGVRGVELEAVQGG